METTEPPNKKRRQHHVVDGHAKDCFVSLWRVHPCWSIVECLRLRSALCPRYSTLYVLTVCLSVECETVDEVPEPSAPMPALADSGNPVRVLTSLQAMRILYCRDPPRLREDRSHVVMAHVVLFGGTTMLRTSAKSVGLFSPEICRNGFFLFVCVRSFVWSIFPSIVRRTCMSTVLYPLIPPCS